MTHRFTAPLRLLDRLSSVIHLPVGTITTTIMSNTYQRLPIDETPANPTDLGRPIDDAREPDPSHRPLRAAVQAEFNRPPPSWWKRAALILSMVLMIWLTFKLGGMGNSKPKVIYATRFVSFLSSCSAFPSCLQPTHSPYPRLQIDVPFFFTIDKRHSTHAHSPHLYAEPD